MNNLQEVGLESGGDEELPAQISATARSSSVAARGPVCDSWATTQSDGDAQPSHSHVRDEKGTQTTEGVNVQKY